MKPAKMREKVKAEIRENVDAFWKKFSDDDLQKIAAGDPVAMADFLTKGGDRLCWLERKIMTPDELQELKQIEAEIRDRERTKGNSET